MLENGVHFFSSCQQCSAVSVRHNNLLPIIMRALREIERAVTEGEAANWLPGNRSLQPFDFVVAEPLPDASGGNVDDAPTVAPTSLVGYDVGVADPTRLGSR